MSRSNPAPASPKVSAIAHKPAMPPPLSVSWPFGESAPFTAPVHFQRRNPTLQYRLQYRMRTNPNERGFKRSDGLGVGFASAQPWSWS